MKIACIGAGPGGLFFAIRMKQADPRHEVVVFERNPADATFGFGVVFSERTFDKLTKVDPETFGLIDRASRHWSSIEIRHRGRRFRAGGNGFTAIARMKLLQILQWRASELGVALRFGQAVDRLAGYALVVAADGANSRVRQRYAARFGTEIDVGPAKFIWFGTTQAFDALTFDFVESEHGRFGVHAYPYDERHGTFIVECDEDTWQRAGLDRGDLPVGASDEKALAYCERVFAECLAGHPLIGNASTWRNFPTIRNRAWHHDNIVLIGDAAHTAHFSVGSGTKMAMEDALELSRCLTGHGGLTDALVDYEQRRRAKVEHIQGAAEPSRYWWERFGQRMQLDPEQFVFHFLTRTGHGGAESLRGRDPGLVTGVERWWAGSGRPAPIDTSCTLRRLVIPTRLVNREFARGAGLVMLTLDNDARLLSVVRQMDPSEADVLALDFGTDFRSAIETVEAVRATWPADRPLAVFLTPPGNLRERRGELDALLSLARLLRARGCDLIGVAPCGTPGWPGERPALDQLLLCDAIRNEVGLATMMLGGVLGEDDANTQILAGRVDLVWEC